jgi:predicted TIM-barrel fold metal-dependent hydrolase
MGSIDHSFSASRLPVASWDTHVHVFDSTIGPFAEGSAYTPGHAPLTELRRFTQSLSEGDAPVNLVIVQASPYGTDNSVLLSSLKTLQADSNITARGIAVVDIHNVTGAELWALHEVGVRGLRLNKMASHHTFSVGALISDIKLAASRIKQLPNWKLQLFVSGRVWDGENISRRHESIKFADLN